MDEDISKLFELIKQGDLQGLKDMVADTEVKKRKRDSILDSLNGEGETVLHIAAQCNHPAIIRWLLSSAEEGGRAAGFTNVLAKTTREGWTAMHLAAFKGYLECCQALVEGSMVDNGERAELLNSVANEGWSVLHFAAHKDRPSVINWLLSSSEGGGRANGFTMVLARDKNGLTAMHRAAYEGYLECCQALVEGSMVENGEREELLNAVNEEGWTALHCATQRGHPSIVRWLFSSAEGGGRAAGFSNVVCKTTDGMTVFLYAAYCGHLECCQALVEGCNIDNGELEELFNAADNEGWTILHAAAIQGHEHIIRWLLSSSKGGGRTAGFTNILSKTKSGTTVLHLAAEKGYLECCRALVEGSLVDNGERADLLNDVDNKGRTALHYAAQNPLPDIIRWLLSSEEGGGRAAGFTNVLAKLDDGWTAMHIAVDNGHLECCQALVEGSMVDNGERAELLNGVNNNRWSPLHFAAYFGYLSIIRWLLSSEEGGGRAAGFTKDFAKANDGRTVLHLAAFSGHLECCQALVEDRNIDNGERAELLNAVDSDQQTALHFAAGRGHPTIVSWLLSSSEGGGRAAGFTSASITAKTLLDSSSALHLVAVNGSVEALNALLSGCTMGERLTLFLSLDKHGWTPLHVAARLCRPEIIRELLLHHPETQTIVDARDKRGMTALHRAVIGGIDDDSMDDWLEGWEDDNFGDPEVVEALLTAPKKQDSDAKQQQTDLKDEDEDESQQAAVVDPNLGIKFE